MGKEDCWDYAEPSWLHEGHIRDDLSKAIENCPDCNDTFLYTTKKPTVGSRIHSEIHPKPGMGEPFAVEGYVSAVGELPTVESLEGSNSLVWEIVSNPKLCWESIPQKTLTIL